MHYLGTLPVQHQSRRDEGPCEAPRGLALHPDIQTLQEQGTLHTTAIRYVNFLMYDMINGLSYEL